jgi:hypothetical protein
MWPHFEQRNVGTGITMSSGEPVKSLETLRKKLASTNVSLLQASHVIGLELSSPSLIFGFSIIKFLNYFTQYQEKGLHKKRELTGSLEWFDVLLPD